MNLPSSVSTIEGCAEACQDLGNFRAQVGFTFSGSQCYCHYNDGNSPSGNSEYGLSWRNSHPVVGPGSDPNSNYVCYSNNRFMLVEGYTSKGDGKCVDSAGQPYNSVEINSIGTTHHCAATCRHLGNLRSHAGFNYDGSTCSCLYIDGRGPYGNDESGLTLTANNGTGFVVDVNESAVGSECYSHNDYEPFDEYDFVGRGWCRDVSNRDFNRVNLPSSVSTIEGCAEACQDLGNFRAQVGFTFSGSQCYCHYNDGNSPSGNSEYGLSWRNSHPVVGPVFKGSDPYSRDWVCYSNNRFMLVKGYTSKGDGKCVDSAGQPYNSVEINSIGTTQICAATCRSLGNLRSQAGFNYDGSTCSCLYIDGRGPYSNDESGLTLTGNNGTGFVIDVDETAVGSECYSHNDYEPFDEYDFVGRGWCRDAHNRDFNRVNLPSSVSTLEGCAEACQNLGNFRAQVGFTFSGSQCYCHYNDGNSPSGNSEYGLSWRSSYPVVFPVRGHDPISSYICYSNNRFMQVEGYTSKGDGKCVDSAGQPYNSVEINSIGTTQYCAATCRSLGNLRSQAGFNYDGSTCSCLYIDGRGPYGNDESGLTLTGNNGTGFVVDVDESAVGSECYSHNDYEPFDEYDFVGRGWCRDAHNRDFNRKDMPLSVSTLEGCAEACQNL
ncbi:hypothetical protein THAOC_18708, partial [Thalassiosira oceanica]